MLYPLSYGPSELSSDVLSHISCPLVHFALFARLEGAASAESQSHLPRTESQIRSRSGAVL